AVVGEVFQAAAPGRVDDRVEEADGLAAVLLDGVGDLGSGQRAGQAGPAYRMQGEIVGRQSVGIAEGGAPEKVTGVRCGEGGQVGDARVSGRAGGGGRDDSVLIPRLSEVLAGSAPASGDEVEAVIPGVVELKSADGEPGSHPRDPAAAGQADGSAAD